MSFKTIVPGSKEWDESEKQLSEERSKENSTLKNLMMNPQEIMDQITMLDAEEMETLMHYLADYFLLHNDELLNMEALKIAKHLFGAYELIKARKSN